MLGNVCGRCSIVDGDTLGKTKCGKRSRRRIPRDILMADVHGEIKLALQAHATYWVDKFLDARDLSNKLRYTDGHSNIHRGSRSRSPPEPCFRSWIMS